MRADLSPTAATFWQATVDAYLLRVDQLLLLEETCRAIGEREHLAAALEDAPATGALQLELSERRLHVAELVTALDLEHTPPRRGLRLVVDNPTPKDNDDA